MRLAPKPFQRIRRILHDWVSLCELILAQTPKSQWYQKVMRTESGKRRPDSPPPLQGSSYIQNKLQIRHQSTNVLLSFRAENDMPALYLPPRPSLEYAAGL